jgi:hypothetical protein
LLSLVVFEVLALLEMLIISFSFLWKWKSLYFACSSSASILPYQPCIFFLIFAPLTLWRIYGMFRLYDVYMVMFLYISFREPSFFHHVKYFQCHRCHFFLSTFFLYPSFSTALWILSLMFHHILTFIVVVIESNVFVDFVFQHFAFVYRRGRYHISCSCFCL